MADAYEETDDQVDDWFEVDREKVLNYRANERFIDINVGYDDPDQTPPVELIGCQMHLRVHNFATCWDGLRAM